MTLRDLVLTSIENYDSFVVNGKTLTDESYAMLYDDEVENFYLDIDKNTMMAIMVVKLMEK